MNKIINLAKKTLENGNLVIFPTETVYGLGGDATNENAIKKIYNIKQRPLNNPLICHFYNIKQIELNFRINSLDYNLANIFWPGPLTLILKKKNTSKITPLLSNNLNFVGCRIPNNLTALELLKSVNFPIAAPSANLATKISPTKLNDISKELINKSFFIDGGLTNLGLESTVITTKENKIKILRLGSITIEEIQKALPHIIIEDQNKNMEKYLSPGNQKKHYSTSLPIRINVTDVKESEGLLNFGINNLKSNICEYNLSKKENLKEASRNFFHYLHLIDKSNCKCIAVAPIPSYGLGKTINDRLKRASAKDE